MADRKLQKQTLLEAALEQRQKQGKTRWKHRAVLIALKDEIKDAIDHGMTMKETWNVAVASGRTDMTYETFRRFCREEGLKKKKDKTVANPEPPPSSTRAKGFHHSPFPDLKKLYGE